ncbi:MAG TPA: FHA domain-containing protein, partial [Polyangiaceae bacterium]|nr:FHA domain-containing protein [Polyangiaceae bacterium]
MKELDDTQEVELPKRAEKRATSQTVPRPPADRVQLVVVAGARVGQTFPVQHSTLIGRAEEASVQIDDAEISRRHALVRNIGEDRYIVEDLESRNGTVVNGVRIERSELHLGDRIQLGSRLVLQFVRHERIEDVLRHQQRLETLGRLCVGVAHDLNNMLAVILSNLECIELELDGAGKPSSVVNDCLDDLKTATDHAAKLTPRLLAFGRPDERNMMRIDLSALCSELLPVLRRSLPRNIDVQSNIKPSLAVHGIAADLQQVLMNLCINARDAMKDGGTLHIEARLEPPTESGSPRRIGIRVSDTGEGMDDAVRTRIFEPFFTT